MTAAPPVMMNRLRVILTAPSVILNLFQDLAQPRPCVILNLFQHLISKIPPPQIHHFHSHEAPSTPR